MIHSKGARARTCSWGGAGFDIVRYSASDAGVEVSLQDGTGTGGHAEGDTLTDIEALEGSEHDDELTGDAGENWLFGNAGDDELDGGEGDDWLEGGAGYNILEGGGGRRRAHWYGGHYFYC